MTHSSRFVFASCATLLFAVPNASAQEATWSDRIAIDGDFRLRFESIDVSDAPDRERSRLRARLGLEALIADDITFHLRLATGDGSPVSSNVTLDSGFSMKDIRIDRAYVDWRLNDAWDLRAGKMRSPWFRPGGSQLIWDNDLNPEGAAARFESGPVFGSVGLFAVEERSSSDDSLLTTLQAGWKARLSDGNSLTAGVGYFVYSDTVGNAPFYNGSASGNSVDAAGNYLLDYRLLELFAEYRTSLRDWPLTVYADVVQNTEADTEDSGFTAGVIVGQVRNRGSVEFGYAWQDIEADAVVATFNHSDFAGGVTDSSGHVIIASYGLRDNVELAGTLFITERGGASGSEQDYNRIMLDIQFNFE